MNIAKLKDGQTLRINSLKSIEFFTLLKIQLPFLIVFLNQKTGKFIDTKYRVGERLLNGNNQRVKINNSETDYKNLVKEIAELQSDGNLLMIEVSKQEYEKKLPLINIISDIKEEIVKSCVYLDYIDGMFSIIYKPLPDGKPAKMYYFEETNSVLGFSADGPMLISDTTKINSIEDLIC